MYTYRCIIYTWLCENSNGKYEKYVGMFPETREKQAGRDFMLLRPFGMWRGPVVVALLQQQRGAISSTDGAYGLSVLDEADPNAAAYHFSAENSVTRLFCEERT